MTPAARLQAAIDIIDKIREGSAAEKALTNWARASRFAGSKDRAAVRDHVFDCLRLWRSAAALGGGETGRARMLGVLRHQGLDEAALFSGQGHGPAELSDEEAQAGGEPQGFAAWDLPDWLGARFQAGLGDQAEATAQALRSRASVFLRVNTLKTDQAGAQAALAEAGIETQPHGLSPTALHVTEGARKVARSEPYLTGLVELQDAASQAVVDAIPVQPGQRVLDYCAGGGGKTLALAARLGGERVFAHDADPRRMSDLPARAERAGANVDRLTAPKGEFDVVLCDVPCSGAGAWRRSPEGKWRLQPEDLQDLTKVQAGILQTCQGLVTPGGLLAYATCSVLAEENLEQVERFLAQKSGWECLSHRQFLPEDGGDGFFVACLRKG